MTLILQGTDNSVSAPAVQGGTAGTTTGVYYPASNVVALATNGVEAMRLNSNSNLVLAGGTTTASGVGVTFPATQSASSDANCLDDYEEGTFTPVLSADSGATSGGGTIAGRYTKVGRFVYVNVTINTVSKNTLSGSLRISGMPFVNADANANGIIRFDWGAVVTGYYVCVPEIPSGATAFDLQLFNLYQYVGQLQASNCGATISVYSMTACYSV